MGHDGGADDADGEVEHLGIAQDLRIRQEAPGKRAQRGMRQAQLIGIAHDQLQVAIVCPESLKHSNYGISGHIGRRSWRLVAHAIPVEIEIELIRAVGVRDKAVRPGDKIIKEDPVPQPRREDLAIQPVECEPRVPLLRRSLANDPRI